ncbi:MAG: hypothetical protein JXL97_17170 [Bacteroidales bacterium]|nr:hypothetical protein [Bacteroidales bacterium]
MKKISLFTISALFSIIAVFAVSCEKNELNISEENNSLVIPKNTVSHITDTQVNQIDNQNRKIISFAIAKSLQNPEFRTFIKEEAMKQFDGDYDILYQNLKDKSIIKGKTLEDFIFDAYVAEKGTNATKDDFENIIKSIPDFQISVPINCEKWDAIKEIPLATYIPFNFDEQTTKFVTAYDFKGNTYYLSTGVEPDVPVVVIGSCERNDKALNTNQTSFYNPKNSEKYQYNKPVILNCIHFIDLSLYETWIQGKPEIRGELYREGSEHSLGNFYAKPNRSDVDQKSKVYNLALIPKWYSSYGDHLYIKFWEEDVETTIEVGLTISTSIPIGQTHPIPITPSVPVKLKWTVGEDDAMGEYTINVLDNQIFRSNGSFKFIISQ